MIILKELILNNFLSHEKTDIKFEAEDKLLIDGRSGSGKSSIVEALLWGFYAHGRADNNRNLIKRGKKMAKVIIYVNNDNISYRIERSVTDKGKHELTILESSDGTQYAPVKINGIKNLQEYLEKEILHSSYTLFINSIVYPQDNAESFIKQPANKKKDLLLEIVNVAKYDEYYKKTRDKLSELNIRIASDQGMITSLTEFNEAEIAKITDKEAIKTNLTTAKQKNEAAIKEKDTLEAKIMDNRLLLAKINGLADQVTAGEIRLKRCNNDIDDLDDESMKISDDNINDLKKKTIDLPDNRKSLMEISAAEDKRNVWQEKMMALLPLKPISKNFDKLLEEANKQLIVLMRDVPEADKPYLCPSCGANINRGEVCPDLQKISDLRKINMDRLEQAIIDITREKEEYIKNETDFLNKQEALGPAPFVDTTRKMVLQDMIKQQEECLEILKEVENKKLQIITTRQLKLEEKSKIELEINTLTTEKDKLSKQVIPTDMMEARLISLKNEISKNESDIYTYNILLNNIENSEKRIAENKVKISELQAANKQNLIDIEDLALLKEALSPNGVKAMVIDYIIPYLEDKINNILSQLSDFRINLETQKETIDGESVIEGLFINIINELGEKSEFANYSGGEKLKIIVAISEALSEIQNMGFRILDEMFMALDSDSTENFVVTLQKIQSRFAQFICISHLQQIKDLFEKKISVNKYNGTSTIV